MSIDALLSLLKAVRKRGPATWSARCPAHDDRNPSLSIADANGRPLIHCHAGCDPESVLAAVGLSWSDILGDAPVVAKPYTGRRHVAAGENDGAALDVRQRRQRCNRLWAECVPLDDPRAQPAVDYLTARIHPSIVDRIDRRVIRCHPNLDHYDPTTGHAGAWPAMVALVQGPDGTPVGLHRTWLDHDGRKAPVTTPRLSLGAGTTMTGGAIRMMAHDGTIAISEGIETGLAHAHLRGIPTWSCLSATLLQRVQLPAGIVTVHIVVDVDASGTGQNAALALAKRLRATHRVVLEWPTADLALITGGTTPAQNLDWADLAGART